MGKHKTKSQDDVFLSFMEDHEDLARGFAKGDRVLQEELWNQLADQLNACGPPKKETAAWKKVWLDWRASIKKKLVHNKRELAQTGGGKNNMFTLSNAEETVARLCGLYTCVEGIPNTRTFGVPCQQNEASTSTLLSVDSFLEDDLEEAASAANFASKAPISAVPKQQNTPEVVRSTLNESIDLTTPSHVLLPSAPKIDQHSNRQRNATGLGDILDMESKNFKYLGDKIDKLCETQSLYLKQQEYIRNCLEEIKHLKSEELQEIKRHHLQMEKIAEEKIVQKQEWMKLKQDFSKKTTGG